MYINRLKEIREDRDLSQTQVANKISMTQQQYSRYELGIRNIPIEKLDKLADFYDTSVDYLIGRTDERKPYKKSILK